MKTGKKISDKHISMIGKMLSIAMLILVVNNPVSITQSKTNETLIVDNNSFSSIEKPIPVNENQIALIQDGTQNWGALVNDINLPNIWENAFDLKVEIVDKSVEMIVGLKANYKAIDSLPAILSTTNSRIISSVNEINAILVRTPLQTLGSFISQTSTLDTVKYIEPNGLMQITGYPTDPDWEKQWGFEVIDTNKAWDIETGDFSYVLVAVIDTGINYTHPDIVNQYVALGYDWIDNDTTPYDLLKTEYSSGHGTFIAGIIAATANNSIGIAGIANVQVMAERIFNATGWGDFYDGVRGIVHATDAGADILSMSYGFTWRSQAHEDACKYAYDNGVILIASSGNEGFEITKYPASFENIISVGAATNYTNADNVEYYGRAGYSSYGESLDLLGPGDYIYSLDAAGGYRSGSGTSYACPHVTGVAALMKSKYSDWTNDLIIDRILDTAVDFSDLNWEIKYGHGLVNAYNALEELPRADLSANIEVPITTFQGSDQMINATITNWGSDLATNIFYEVKQNDKTIQNGTLTSLDSLGSTTLHVPWLVTENSTQEFTLIIKQVSFELRTENNIITRQTKILDRVNSIALLHNSVGFSYPDISYIRAHYQSKGFYVEDILKDITYEKISSFTHLFIGCRFPDDVWLDSEITAIEEFIEKGGVCVLFSADPTDGSIELARKYGITYTNSSYSSHFYTDHINQDNPLMQGISRLANVYYDNSLIISGEVQPMFYDYNKEYLLGASVKIQKGLLCVLSTETINACLKYHDNSKILDNLLEWNYPQIELDQFQDNFVADGIIRLNWTAFDRNDDTLTFNLYCWNGEEWTLIASDISKTNYRWNSWSVGKGDFYKIKVEAFDGRYTSFDVTTDAFTVKTTTKLIAILVPSIAIPIIALVVIIPVLLKRKKK